jgi:hypothetical protein
MRAALLLLALLPAGLPGQPAFSAEAFGGQTLRIHPRYPEIARPAFALALTAWRQAQGEARWEAAFGLPRTGLRLLWLDPGAPAAGRAWGLAPCIAFPLLRSRGFALEGELAYGLARLGRPFDLQANPANTALGSRWNNLTQLGLRASLCLHPRMALLLGLSAAHLSSADFRLPNLGLNVAGAQAGLQWGSARPLSRPPRGVRQPFLSRLRPGFRAGWGLVSVKTPGGPLYSVRTFSLFAQARRGLRLRLKAGADLFYHQGIYDYLQQHGSGGELRQQALGGSLWLGWEWMLGRTSLSGQAGPYWKKPFLWESYRLYTHFGVQRYWFRQQERPCWNPFAGVYVFAHGGEADFPELALGCAF